MSNTNPYQPIAPGAYTPAFPGTPPTIGSVFPGGVSATPAADTNALFAGLLELRWRDVGVPYTKLRNRIRQDLVIHKFIDRDGAHIEGTGRHPIEISARIPLLNGLTAGPNERWQRPLYPFVWGNLVRAVCDKTSGKLQHPELGDLTCKCEVMEWELDAQVRSGVWADLTWIESDDTGIDLDQALSNTSPLANAQAAAADLDGQLSTVGIVAFPQPYVPPISFNDMMQSIRAVVDTTTLMQKEFAGRIDNVLYECGALGDSLARANSCLNWPLVDAAERMKSAAYDLKATLLTKNRAISLYTVAIDCTMAQVANDIGAPLLDIMNLNSAYVGQSLVLSGSIVRYYASAA